MITNKADDHEVALQSQPSCRNGQISPIGTARSLVTYPEGAVFGSERPPWKRGLP